MRRRPVATILVGPCVLLREGLSRILSAADFRIFASASYVDDAVLSALPQQQPSLLIIDAGDDLDAAIEQVGLFKNHKADGRIAVLANHDKPNDIVAAFRAGANAYFIKVAPCDAFVKTLELVMLGETILPPAILSVIRDPEADHASEPVVERPVATAEVPLAPENGSAPRLSAREKCILNCLVGGDSNKVIARKVGIAEATVKVHVKAILRKIRVHNRTQAAIWAMNNGAFGIALDEASPVGVKMPVQPALASRLVRALPDAHAITSQVLSTAPIDETSGEAASVADLNRRSC
jgi:two-component system nitrate/nitrite response regulator NarL